MAHRIFHKIVSSICAAVAHNTHDCCVGDVSLAAHWGDVSRFVFQFPFNVRFVFTEQRVPVPGTRVQLGSPESDVDSRRRNRSRNISSRAENLRSRQSKCQQLVCRLNALTHTIAPRFNTFGGLCWNTRSRLRTDFCYWEEKAKAKSLKQGLQGRFQISADFHAVFFYSDSY